MYNKAKVVATVTCFLYLLSALPPPAMPAQEALLEWAIAAREVNVEWCWMHCFDYAKHILGSKCSSLQESNFAAYYAEHGKAVESASGACTEGSQIFKLTLTTCLSSVLERRKTSMTGSKKTRRKVRTPWRSLYLRLIEVAYGCLVSRVMNWFHGSISLTYISNQRSESEREAKDKQ